MPVTDFMEPHLTEGGSRGNGTGGECAFSSALGGSKNHLVGIRCWGAATAVAV